MIKEIEEYKRRRYNKNKRDKYRSDPDYRAKCLERNHRNHARRLAEKLKQDEEI